MKYTILLLASFLYASAFYAQSATSASNLEDKVPSLEERMAFHKIPGASAAVFRNYELDTLFQLGYQDADKQVPVNVNTRFQFGSTTGALVKFAIMRLVNDGKIDLDAAANDYLQSWKIPQKGFTKKDPITVRDLLLHKRGFRAVYKPSGYISGSKVPTWEQIMAGEAPSNLPDLKLKRSKAKNQSLANTLILQRLLEDVHQQDFPTLMQKAVFEPLGMKNSMIAMELTDAQARNAAEGHEEDGTTIAGKRRIYPELAHSGLWTTPLDYATFVMHIFKAAKGMDNRFLSQDLAMQGVTQQHENHALILLRGDINYWGGAPRGFYAQFAGNVDEGWVVVGCANRELAWEFINRELNAQNVQYATRTK